MKKIFLSLIFLVSFFVFFDFAEAATKTAASCSLSDILSAYNSAAAGDIIAIPSGDCVWAGGLTLTKPVTLQGAGGSLTKITHNAGSGIPLISISPSSGNENSLFRVTGIYFNYGTSAQYMHNIAVSGNCKQLRIDNNIFNKGGENIRIWVGTKRINGVIDHNTFIDNNNAIRAADYADFYNTDPTNSSWGRALTPGNTGTDALYIETNTFTITNFSGCNSMNESIYHMNAARTVIRYNTFNIACGPYSDTHLDAHGLAGCDRGTRFSEIYHNTWNVPNHVGLWKWMHLRGGSYIIYDNEVNVPNGTAYVNLRNENYEYYGDTAWPSTDQIHNSFLWNNKVNNVVETNPIGIEPSQSAFFQNGRDYFLHAPQSSGGKTTFGSVPGLSNVDCYSNGYMKLPNYPNEPIQVANCCTGLGTGNCSMTFSSSGPNAYYPYSSYTYPHPLVTGQNPPVCTPSCSGKQCGDNGCGSPCSSCPSGQTCANYQCQTPPPVQTFVPGQYIEAENGTLNSPMGETSDSGASGGKYISTSTDEQGSVSFTFNITTAGKYKLEAKVNSNNDSGQNSFYVGLDSESAQGNNYYSFQSSLTSGYVWDDVSRTGNGTSLPEFDPMIFDLTKGTHTFTFHGREANTWLDQIILKPYTAPPAGGKKGDLNSDSKVDIFDYTLFSQNFGKTGSSIADLNSDSKVDIFDYTIFAGEFGKSF